MHRRFCSLTLFFLFLVSFPVLNWADIDNGSDAEFIVTSEDSDNITLSIRTENIRTGTSEFDGRTYQVFTLNGEGQTSRSGMPALPAVSRLVIVPPRAGLQLEVIRDDHRQVNSVRPPRPFSESSDMATVDLSYYENGELYPPEPVTMSSPMIMRGVRFVTVTVYPVQYNPADNTYIHHDRVDVKVRYTNEKPVNPLTYDLPRRNQSPEFIKLFDAMAVNGNPIRRDFGEIGRDYVGHYLVVSHEDCLPYAIPFIEWRRRSGYKVDILSYEHEIANDPREVVNIKDDIQDLYDDYLDAGIDPFEYILFIGDRERNIGRGEWILRSFEGNPSMRTADHADYMFGLLEGDEDDHIPDVGIGRFACGNEDMMELVVAKTLSYEMNPWLENTDWFNRAGVYTQRWGDDWNITLNLTTRWGEKALRESGYSEILYKEADEDTDGNGQVDVDSDGDIIGPVLARWFNEQVNLLIGRSSNFYWNNANSQLRLRGVFVNTVFPIVLNLGGHSEFAMQNAFRTGHADSLLGAVAWTSGWGTPATIFNNGIWLSLVSGVVIHDMTVGWGKMYAGINFKILFPDEGPETFQSYMTDTDYYGDPAIQPWIGVPRQVEASFPDEIPPSADMIEITVSEIDSENPVDNAWVTLYQSGEMPDDDEYADWEPEFMMVARTDIQGLARFILQEELSDHTLYVTVTGRDIYPFLDEIEIAPSDEYVQLESFEIDDNDDGRANPGETIEISLTARNSGERDEASDVYAIITSVSEFLEAHGDTLRFGDIRTGESADADEAATVHILPSCPDQSEPMLIVDFFSGEMNWRSSITFDIWAPAYEVTEIVNGEIISRGASELNLELTNTGRVNGTALNVQLVSDGWEISVDSDQSSFRAIPVNRAYRLNGGLFRVRGHIDAVPGIKVPMKLLINSADGLIHTIPFELQVEEPGENTPQGPDGYGYYCFDDSDTNWTKAPEYDWFGIGYTHPHAVNGIKFDFDDDVDTIEALPLPFTWRFYGRDYDTITVSKFGFIAPGNQTGIQNFQDYRLDQAIGGAMGMAAPMWGRFYWSNNRTGVFHFYDDWDHKFIIEWDTAHHHGQPNNIENRFQVILYDPDVYITPSGDSDIEFIYRLITQVRGENEFDTPYSSVGISSPDGTTGISYTYNGDYPVTSDSLRNQKAILFSTTPRPSTGTRGFVFDDETGELLEGAQLIAFNDEGVLDQTQTDSTGLYHFYSLLIDPDHIAVNMPGYRGFSSQDTTIIEVLREIDLYLLRPEIEVNREGLAEVEELIPGIEAERTIIISNTGTGPLEFTSRYAQEDIDWITNEPESGRIEAGESTEMILSINTVDLDSGDHSIDLIISDSLVLQHSTIPIRLNVDEDNSTGAEGNLPLEWFLDRPYPNPFNNSTSIRYGIKETSHVVLAVYDIKGRLLKRLVNEEQNAGRYKTVFSDSNLPSGLYLYAIHAGTYNSVRRMVIIK